MSDMPPASTGRHARIVGVVAGVAVVPYLVGVAIPYATGDLSLGGGGVQLIGVLALALTPVTLLITGLYAAGAAALGRRSSRRVRWTFLALGLVCLALVAALTYGPLLALADWRMV
jgi:hypothetical protein